MSTTPLVKGLQAALEDLKAQDIKVLDVRSLTDITDYMVIATATSNRHAKALAGKTVEAAKIAGVKPLSREGEPDAEWILVDLDDVLVHIMQADAREFYALEKLWYHAESMREANS